MDRPTTPLHKELFGALLDVPADRREAELARLAGGDTALESRLRALLAAHARAEEVLGAIDAEMPSPSVPTSSEQPEVDALRAGERIGAYVLERELGTGGFGRVWLAAQTEPVRRPVALKLLKAGMDTREVVARFQAERQALARMEHPGIAKVYDAGETDRGRPWFAMEFVDGEPITDWCDRRHADLEARLQVLAEVCRAVQHAHTKGVVHRDLKPSNVLVTESDGAPRPIVIDFGIAKAVEEPLVDASLVTRHGQWIGTPAYMAPEQLGSGADVDTRADVYALGALLHVLLVGEPPRTGDPSSDPDWRRRVTTERSPRPSTRIGARAEPSRPGVTRATVRRELDWIVGRCLEADPERRYDSAAVLANELERVVAGEPVLAGPPTVAYRFAKFVRRNRVSLAVAASVFAVLLVALLFALDREERARTAESLARRNEVAARAAEAEAMQSAEAARRAEQQARAELERASAVALLTEHMLLSVKPSVARGADTALMTEVLERAERYILDHRDASPTTEAELARLIGGAWWELGEARRAEPLLDRALRLRREALGATHADTLQSMRDLSALQLQRGDLVAAEPLLTELHAAYADADLSTSEDARSVAASYATLLEKTGRADECLVIRRAIVDALERRRAPDAEDVLMARNNLASVLSDLGRPAEALEIYEAVFRAQVASPELGSDHPHTLMTANNIAGLMRDTGREEEALELMRATLLRKRAVFPPGHVSLLTSLNNLGELENRLGHAERAEALYREALDLARRHLGVDAEPTRILELNLAKICLAHERDQEAYALLEPAARRGRALSGPTRSTLHVENALALALLRLDRAADAEPYARRAATDARDHLPADSGEAARFAVLHGEVLAALGRDEEARDVLVTAHEALAADGGTTDHARRAATCLADLADARGDADEAARWRERAAR